MADLLAKGAYAVVHMASVACTGLWGAWQGEQVWRRGGAGRLSGQLVGGGCLVGERSELDEVRTMPET